MTSRWNWILPDHIQGPSKDHWFPPTSQVSKVLHFGVQKMYVVQHVQETSMLHPHLCI